jgi:hypothetical protein
MYANDGQPTQLNEERGITKEPLAIVLAPGQKLDPLSRVNFGKVYTIEHNIKVSEVGKVSAASLPKLKAYWNNRLQD